MLPIRYLQSIKIAADMAFVAHKDQKRKHIEVPFVIHPARVSELVLLYDNTEYLGAIASWLHDIIEDCGVLGKVLFDEGLVKMPISDYDKDQIRRGVEALTKNDNISPRQKKWDDALERVMDPDAPKFTKLIKMCDRIDNLSDLNGFKQSFVITYLIETSQLIDLMEKTDLTISENMALDTLKFMYKQKLLSSQPQSL
jgi:(p)ppGpp synthase/HD superfamily hydrolase